MNCSASSGGKSASTTSIKRKPVSGDLAVPFRVVEDIETIALGFRMEMFSLGDNDKNGGVATGAGCGTDFIILSWRDKTIVIRGLELLKAWVETFAPADAEQFPTD